MVRLDTNRQTENFQNPEIIFHDTAQRAPKVIDVIDKLERDHMNSEKAARDLRRVLDAAFTENADPLTGHYPPTQEFEKLFSLIVTRAPSPIGLG